MDNLGIVFLRLIQRHPLRYLAVALGGFLLAFSLLYFVPTPMWQVSGLVRIGHAPSTTSDEYVSNEAVMSAEASMALLRQEASANVGESVARGEPWNLRVRPAAENLLELKVQATSLQKATEIYSSLIRQLKLVHDPLFAARTAFWKKQQERVAGDLEIGRKIRESHTDVCQNFATKSLESGLLCSNLLANEAARLERQAKLEGRIAETLLPIWSYPTETSGDLALSQRPVSPNRLTAALLSAFIALVFLMIVLLVHSARTVLRRTSE